MSARDTVARGQGGVEAVQDILAGVALKRPVPGGHDGPGVQHDTQCDVRQDIQSLPRQPAHERVLPEGISMTAAADLRYISRTVNKGDPHVKSILAAFAALAVTASGGSALADPPKTLHVTRTVDIAAPVDKVWSTVKDFDSLNKWHPGFARDEIVKGDNNKPGAVRKLTIKDGPSFTEELLSFDPVKHVYRYRIIESPLPVRDYVSHISVKPGPNGGSHVTWTGTFKRKSNSDNPPEAENDTAATKLITGVYEGGLANLKQMLGG